MNISKAPKSRWQGYGQLRTLFQEAISNALGTHRQYRWPLNLVAGDILCPAVSLVLAGASGCLSFVGSPLSFSIEIPLGEASKGDLREE